MDLGVALAVFEYVVLLLALSWHDLVQSWLANRLGDPTARMLGRMTLNPLKHFDVLGTAIFPILYIFRSPLVLGWTKQVPVTVRNLRRGSRDEMMVYASGPAANLAAAAVCLLLLVIGKTVSPAVAAALPVAAELTMRNPGVGTEGLPTIFPIVLLLYCGILVNLLLFAFNLVPLPTLDGGKILRHFLPYNAAQQYDRMGFYLMLAFFFIGFRIILTIANPLLNLFNALLSAL